MIIERGAEVEVILFIQDHRTNWKMWDFCTHLTNSLDYTVISLRLFHCIHGISIERKQLIK